MSLVLESKRSKDCKKDREMQARVDVQIWEGGREGGRQKEKVKEAVLSSHCGD